MAKRLFALLVLAAMVGGCTPALQFSEISPNIGKYNPRSVAVLPFTNSIGMQTANDATGSKLMKGLHESKQFDRIVDPGQVKAYMMQNSSAIDVITRYRTTWVATGMSDAKLATWIGKALNADSIVFGEVTAWSEQTTPYHHIYDAGLALRWVDSASGEILWKASEVYEIRAGNPCIFDCSNPDHAMDLAMDLVVSNWPKTGVAAK
jgi:hypothetical protein